MYIYFDNYALLASATTTPATTAIAVLGEGFKYRNVASFLCVLLLGTWTLLPSVHLYLLEVTKRQNGASNRVGLHTLSAQNSDLSSYRVFLVGLIGGIELAPLATSRVAAPWTDNQLKGGLTNTHILSHNSTIIPDNSVFFYKYTIYCKGVLRRYNGSEQDWRKNTANCSGLHVVPSGGEVCDFVCGG